MKEVPAAKFREIYELLVGADIEFVLLGGAAANLLGSARFTLDVDIAYSRREENIAKIVRAFRTIHPYLRQAPAGLPFQFDARTIRNGLNILLSSLISAQSTLWVKCQAEEVTSSWFHLRK